NSLWAASSSSFDRDKGHGIVYQLEPSTLKTKSAVKIARLGFATALDEEHERLYIGNTLDGSVTVIDTLTGKELSVIPLTEGQDEAHFRPTREMVIDKKNQRLYVSSAADKGALWVIDMAVGKKIKTIDGLGHAVTGIALNKNGDNIYLVNGDGEIINLDASSYEIKKRFVVEPEKKHFFLNVSLDEKNGRAFITDPDIPGVLVVDVNSGKILHRIDVINSLAILFNPLRNEIYITHRNAKQVSIVDSNSYYVKTTIKTRLMPNSLSLSHDGENLYVSVKQEKKEMSTMKDYILKIELSKIAMEPEE
ncbi:YncE family protein, partial [Klebsiella pneumoniae]